MTPELSDLRRQVSALTDKVTGLEFDIRQFKQQRDFYRFGFWTFLILSICLGYTTCKKSGMVERDLPPVGRI